MRIYNRTFSVKLLFTVLFVLIACQQLLSQQYNPYDKEQILKNCSYEASMVIGINLKKLKATNEPAMAEELLKLFFADPSEKPKNSESCLKLLKMADHLVIYKTSYETDIFAFKSSAEPDQWENLLYLFEEFGAWKLKLSEQGNGRFNIIEFYQHPSGIELSKKLRPIIIVGKLSNELPENLTLCGLFDGIDLQRLLWSAEGERSEQSKKFIRHLGFSEEYAKNKLSDLLDKVDLKKDFWWIYREEIRSKKPFITCVGQLDFDSSDGKIEIYCNPEKSPRKLQNQVFGNIQSTGIVAPFKKFLVSEVQDDKIVLTLKNSNTAFQFFGLQKQSKVQISKPVTKAAAHNLNQLAKAIAMYRAINEASPKSLDALINEDFINPADIKSTLNKSDQDVTKDNYPKDDFIYVPLPIGSPKHLILAYENPKYHNNKGTNVLLEDLSMKYLDIDTFNALLRETKELVQQK